MNRTIVKYGVLLLIINFIISKSVAQSNITDSLKIALNNSSDSRSRAKVFFKLSDAYSKTNIDTAYFYINQAKNITDKINEDWYSGRTLYHLGNVFFIRGYMKKLLINIIKP